jgi:hypothetical protein
MTAVPTMSANPSPGIVKLLGVECDEGVVGCAGWPLIRGGYIS